MTLGDQRWHKEREDPKWQWPQQCLCTVLCCARNYCAIIAIASSKAALISSFAAAEYYPKCQHWLPLSAKQCLTGICCFRRHFTNEASGEGGGSHPLWLKNIYYNTRAHRSFNGILSCFLMIPIETYRDVVLQRCVGHLDWIWMVNVVTSQIR